MSHGSDDDDDDNYGDIYLSISVEMVDVTGMRDREHAIPLQDMTCFDSWNATEDINIDRNKMWKEKNDVTVMIMKIER